MIIILNRYVNHLPVKVMRKGVWETITWEDVSVGKILLYKIYYTILIHLLRRHCKNQERRKCSSRYGNP